jgi:hypothetical protein
VDIVVGVGSVVLYAAVVGLLMTGSRRRRALLMALATALFAVPFFLRESAFFTTAGRALLSLGSVGTYVRFVDLAKERDLPGVGSRSRRGGPRSRTRGRSARSS